MPQYFVNFLFGKTQPISDNNSLTVKDLFVRKAVSSSEFYVTCKGKLADKDGFLVEGCTYTLVPRVLGGKGGFGSMLRAIGAQIEKTTNREACRDLSGRRMRDVNNEKNLRDWVAKKAEREREKERKRKEKNEKRKQFLEGPVHVFDDRDYVNQKLIVLEQLEEAMQKGLEKTTSSAGAGPSTESRKRKAETDTDTSSPKKKAAEWLGIDVDIDDLSDLSDSDSDTTSTNKPTTSEAHSDSGMESTSVASETISKDTVTSLQMKDNSCISKCGDSHTTLEAKSSENIESQVKDSDSAHQSGDNANVDQREDIAIDSSKEKTCTHGLLSALPPPKAEESKVSQEPVEVKLDECTCEADLEACGLDSLKAELMKRGLKCGGTLQERAARLWSIKGKSKEEIDPSLFAKPSKGKGKKR